MPGLLPEEYGDSAIARLRAAKSVRRVELLLVCGVVALLSLGVMTFLGGEPKAFFAFLVGAALLGARALERRDEARREVDRGWALAAREFAERRGIPLTAIEFAELTGVSELDATEILAKATSPILEIWLDRDDKPRYRVDAGADKTSSAAEAPAEGEEPPPDNRAKQRL